MAMGPRSLTGLPLLPVPTANKDAGLLRITLQPRCLNPPFMLLKNETHVVVNTCAAEPSLHFGPAKETRVKTCY